MSAVSALVTPSPPGVAPPSLAALDARPAEGVKLPTGEARFISKSDESGLFAHAERTGFLPVSVPAARACDRGKLALVLEEAVELALERRGACPPGIGAASDLDTSLSDQLYRARLIELRGLCLAVGPLEAIASLSGALDAEDSAVLRFWLEATRTRPLELALDERNRSLAVYGAPVELASLIGGRTAPVLEVTPSVSPEIAASAATMELSEAPPAVAVAVAVAGADAQRKAAEITNEPILAGDLAQALVAELTHGVPETVNAETVNAETVSHAAEDAGAESDVGGEQVESGVSADAVIVSEASDTPETPCVEAAPESAERAVEVRVQVSIVSETKSAHVSDAALHTENSPAERPTAEPHRDSALVEVAPVAAAEESEAPATERRPPLHPDAVSEWPKWLAEIERARGPKPLGAVERMFVSSYVPLRDAYLRGITPPEVGGVLEGWAASFAKSYTEAFDALRVRGKRPTMVLDIPDTAHRIGRLHGARSVQLLLVDGMRYDLGLRVEQLLRARLGREVALTERLLLWSALPSDSATQLELIGRGPDGLRDFGGPPESEVPVARGRMAKTPRRIKAGHRELLKLDVVEARLSEPGPREAERLDAIADDVAESVGELCTKLPARTLLVVFGDHGFVLDPQGNGTGAARQGGARPEQVLVPAFAWLVGGVQ